MELNKLITLFRKQFPYIPTTGQERLINELSSFILDKNPLSLFVLKGYAGTGKTTIVSALVNILPPLKKSFNLLAPTGRAAKVLSNYSGRNAHTIHRFIYWATTSSDGRFKLVLRPNKQKDTIFIVDEASMIPDGLSSNDFSQAQRSLLEDLINFVYSPQSNCKIILIGDEAQLPPVGLDISPALNVDYLKASFGLDIKTHTLTEVVRQSLNSGILANATKIRNKIEHNELDFPFFDLTDFTDIHAIGGVDLEDLLNSSYSNFGHEHTVVITRSNKRANVYNQQIRHRILFQEEEISAGDFMMVVKNNYFWLPEESSAGFLANGDIIEILSIRKIEELYGFRFADVSIKLIDYPNEAALDVKILLDTIAAESPALPKSENNRLFEEVLKDYEDIPQRRKKLDKMKVDPYFNALQIKFAYALTCHKTQGGQWANVFIDQGYFNEKMLDKEFLRWLYTAVTRASNQLYLVNFKDEFIT
ncbi:MAG: AAA family ATPase [Bacteroidetes bacterium]|nr:AAA family ATPase [Bacteroidota bacterium]